MPITPTVGRKVYFNPGHPSMIAALVASILPAAFVIKGDGPFDATIANVNVDGTVNLGIRDHDGYPHAVQNVPLWDGTGERPDAYTTFAEWMPYQLGQAAKTEQAQQQATAALVPPPAADPATDAAGTAADPAQPA